MNIMQHRLPGSDRRIFAAMQTLPKIVPAPPSIRAPRFRRHVQTAVRQSLDRWWRNVQMSRMISVACPGPRTSPSSAPDRSNMPDDDRPAVAYGATLLRSRLEPHRGADYKKTAQLTHPHSRDPGRSRLSRTRSTQCTTTRYSRNTVTLPLYRRDTTLAKSSRARFGHRPGRKVAAQFTLRHQVLVSAEASLSCPRPHRPSGQDSR